MKARDVAGQLAGFGGTDRLQKMRIEYQRRTGGDGEFEVLFNPSEINRSRQVLWRRQRQAAHGNNWLGVAQQQQFIGIDAESLSVSFLFDTYESRSEEPAFRNPLTTFVRTANPFAQGDATDVRTHTKKIAELAMVHEELHHPPLCRLNWGSQGEVFTGVLTGLHQKFTLFLPNGIPVRATLACTFTEYLRAERIKAREPHSADVVKTVVVHRGDTLQSIAAQEYRDPSLWRHIARANGIVNPRAIEPGRVLTVPKLAG